jgi:tRNA(fMet)-specific endonuclease VapC
VIYLFDTDVFSLCEYRETPEVRRIDAKVVGLGRDDRAATSVITYEEQTRGWLAFAARSRNTTDQVKSYLRLERHLRTYRGLDLVSFSDASAAKFDQLRRLKIRIGTSDLKIAAITLSIDGVLVTRNVRDFQKVPALRIEDWTAA